MASPEFHELLKKLSRAATSETPPPIDLLRAGLRRPRQAVSPGSGCGLRARRPRACLPNGPLKGAPRSR